MTATLNPPTTDPISASSGTVPYPEESAVHRCQETMDLPYATIKLFSDFGCMAGKPLAPGGVEALASFWGRIEQLVATKQFSVSLAKRCVTGAAREARQLAGNASRINGEHVREAISLVQAQSTNMAGFMCRPPGS